MEDIYNNINKDSKKNILITGAGGFIGSFIVERAIKENFNTWAGIRKTTSKEYLQHRELNFIDLPYHDKNKLKQSIIEHKSHFGKWDIIVYNLGITKSNNSDDFEKINYGFCRNFIEALIETDSIPNQFITMSSLSSFGPGDEINMTPITLCDPQTPNTAYGKSKLKLENYLRSLNNFPYIILCPTGVYGPREKDYLMMFKTIKSGFDFSAGYKKQYITFIYVKDLVETIFRIIALGKTKRQYIISENRAYTSSEFRGYIQKELNKKIVIPVKVPLFILKGVSYISEKISLMTGKASTLNMDKYNIMKQRNWICDISAMKEELDFEPEYTLEKGVKETTEWYKQNGWI